MFDVENFSYIREIQPFEWVMLAIYCLVIFSLAFARKVIKQRQNPLYRYYTWGIFAKVVGSIAFCLIYIYYYQGGDTVSYYETSRSLVNLGMKDPGSCLNVMTSAPSIAGYMTFDRETGYPWPYMYFDSQTFFVAKIIAPLVLISFKSYLISSVLLSWLSFFGAWKFFLMLCRYFPGLERRLVLGVLFVPSVLFWGSGILKDTITLSAVCWFIVCIDHTFMRGRFSWRGLLGLLLTLYVLISVKPYVLYSLLPGAMLWVVMTYMTKIHSKFIRITLVPAVLILSIAGAFFALSLLGSVMGKFAIGKMLETAAVTQKDLKADYYEGSSFDIGEFDPTVAGMIVKVPSAMAVGLFRPYIWEARKLVIFISGLENLAYLLTMGFLLFKILGNVRRFFRILRQYPILAFLLCYTLFFAVMVGLSTSNFGALVRFKIPFLPCYISMLLILHYFLSKQGVRDEEESIKASRRNLSAYHQPAAGSMSNSGDFSRVP